MKKLKKIVINAICVYADAIDSVDKGRFLAPIADGFETAGKNAMIEIRKARANLRS